MLFVWGVCGVQGILCLHKTYSLSFDPNVRLLIDICHLWKHCAIPPNALGNQVVVITTTSNTDSKSSKRSIIGTQFQWSCREWLACLLHLDCFWWWWIMMNVSTINISFHSSYLNQRGQAFQIITFLITTLCESHIFTKRSIQTDSCMTFTLKIIATKHQMYSTWQTEH